MLSRGLARALTWGGVRPLLQYTSRWSGVVVLNYHRIGHPERSLFDHALWSAQPEAFASQVRFLKSQLDVIGPDDLAAARRDARGRYGLITFDDGYRDNYDVAFDILKAERVGATFFVVTGFIDSPRVPWWDEIAWMVRTSRRSRIELDGWLSRPVDLPALDREQVIQDVLRVCKRLQPDRQSVYLDAVADATGSGRYAAGGHDLWMTWDMLREMRAAGMTIGGHTVSHRLLSKASDQEQRDEIVGCSRRLAEELEAPLRYFSYPVGGRNSFNDVTRGCLREAGIEFAFSYYGGCRRFVEWDDYDVRRVAIERDVTAHAFRSIVSLPQLFARPRPANEPLVRS